MKIFEFEGRVFNPAAIAWVSKIGRSQDARGASFGIHLLNGGPIFIEESGLDNIETYEALERNLFRRRTEFIARWGHAFFQT